jgi:ABC-type phosphate transport system substrate-binding protein
MKKIIIIAAVVVFIAGFAACSKQQAQAPAEGESMQQTDTANDNSSTEITLTQALIDKYIKTLPPFVKKAKELGESADTFMTTLTAGGEIESLLKDQGWSDPQDFFKVHAKIWSLAPWLMMVEQMKGQSDAMQKQLADQFEELFKSQGVTEQEKQLLLDNQKKLADAVEEANK